MPTIIDPIWSDIIAATAQPGNYEVDARAGDIIADDNRLTGLKAGSSLRIIGGKVKWGGHSSGSYSPLIELNADNIHISGCFDITGPGHGLRAIGRSGLDIDVQIAGRAMSRAKSLIAKTGDIATAGYAAAIDGLRASNINVVAVETCGGVYVTSSARVSDMLDITTRLHNVAKANNIFSAARSSLNTVVASSRLYDAGLTGLNGDGITIGWAEDVDISASITDASCYSVAIGNLNGSLGLIKSRDIRFSELVTRGGVTAALNATGIDGLYVGRLDVENTETSANFSHTSAIIDEARLINTGPVRATDSDVSFGSVRRSGIIYGGNPSPWLIADSDSNVSAPVVL